MTSSGVLTFTKSKCPPNRVINCSGTPCDGKGTINEGQLYWRNGHCISRKHGEMDGDRVMMRLCERCFGFWLARYCLFDYNPMQVDKNDLKWKEYWDREWELQCLAAFFDNLQVGKTVTL